MLRKLFLNPRDFLVLIVHIANTTVFIDPSLLLVERAACPFPGRDVGERSRHIIEFFERGVILEEGEIPMKGIRVFRIEVFWCHLHFYRKRKRMKFLDGLKKLILVVTWHIGEEAEANRGHLGHQLLHYLSLVGAAHVNGIKLCLVWREFLLL
jgi:hypothetical protein